MCQLRAAASARWRTHGVCVAAQTAAADCGTLWLQHGTGAFRTCPGIAGRHKDTTMNYQEQDTYGMYNRQDDSGPGPQLMGANTLDGNDVFNRRGEDLGDIKEIMLDMHNGNVAYAVLSFGGFLGMGEKLFAVPWSALQLDTDKKRFVLDVEKERLADAPGFDKDHWPDMADKTWAQGINDFYGQTPRAFTRN
jgi:sporulation protein YlmC with PRC-barrel domain